MQAQVSSEITFSSTKAKTTKITFIKKENPNTSKNYLELKNQICKDTFHIGC